MKIKGTGFYVPENIIKNNELTDSPGWVEQNTGIGERRKAVNEGSVAMGARAARQALSNAGVKAEDVNLVITATATPDMIAPSTACMIAGEMGIYCTAFDINAVCSGFLYGLNIADGMHFKGYNNILLIGVDVFSRITDYSHRDCVFFGDGAGAVVLGDIEDECGRWAFVTNSYPHDQGFVCEKGGTFKMNGRKVYEKAVYLVPKAIGRVLEISGMEIRDIDYMIPHQPSKKVLQEIAIRIGMPESKVLMNMDRYANTSAATIPILLAENWHRFKKGDKILFASIGSGWTYGAAIYEV